MRIVLLNLPVYLPSVMPYSLTMMHAVLNSELDEDIMVLDINSKYHYRLFKELYEQEEKNFFKSLDEFSKQTRSFYPSISKSVFKGNKPESYNIIIEDILKENPDVVTLSLTYNSQIFFAKLIIDDLSDKGIKVIIGGPADYSIIKDKAVVLKDYKELIDYLIKIGAKTNKIIKKPVLDFSIYNKKKYFTKDIIYPLRTAHSCPYKLCTFCTHHLDTKYETFDLEFIKDIIIKNKMQKICFIDDCFTVSRLKKLSEMIKPLNIKFWLQLRPTRDMIKILPLLYESGLKSVAWGIESGSQRILDLMRKGTKVEDIKEVLKTSHELGIKNQVYVMFGLPGESELEFFETIKFLEDNSEYIDLVSTSVFGLQKNSQIYKHPDKYGIKKISYEKRTFLSEKIIYLPKKGLTHEQVIKLKKNNSYRIESINKIPKVINAAKEQVLNL